MRFSRIYIHNFRQFTDKEIIIGNKITAIAGNNGTGKSTVLGILANSSLLRGHHTYLGKQYKGEFSELFSASREHDPSGGKIELFYSSHGKNESVEFRTTWQNKGTRFRLIPFRKFDDGSRSDAKLQSPVIYLGLSRLYPVGEADRKKLNRQNQGWDIEDDRTWFEKSYKRIIGGWEDVRSVSRFGIVGVSRKAGTGIETESYGPSANSAGQDNLGQILFAVLSMRRLKRELGNDWDGGMLIVDEIDATLHPAAQIRLLDLLQKESGSVGFQVVFTTHSTVILEELSKKTSRNNPGVPGDIEVAYLTDANKVLKVKRNPTWPEMEGDLLVRGISRRSAKVGVFCEDDQAIWLANHLIGFSHPILAGSINFIDAAFGCNELMKLYVNDFEYIRDRLIVFDGDVLESDLDAKIPRALRESGGNIIALPGDGVSPERLIYDYLTGLDHESDLWDELGRYGFTIRLLTDEGPFSQAYSGDTKERNKLKHWFEDYRDVFDLAGVAESWIRNNTAESDRFIYDFTKAYNIVARRTSAVEVPMAKKDSK